MGQAHIEANDDLDVFYSRAMNGRLVPRAVLVDLFYALMVCLFIGSLEQWTQFVLKELENSSSLIILCLERMGLGITGRKVTIQKVLS